MKTLLLLRHAKSDWNDPMQSDFDRPLNARGRDDAPKLGKWISKKHPPNKVICSSAARTQETLELASLNVPVEFYRGLYHASSGELLSYIHKTELEIDQLLVIAHNPGIGSLAYRLVSDEPDDNNFISFPTAACAVIQFEIDNWNDMKYEDGKLIDFTIPKDQ